MSDRVAPRVSVRLAVVFLILTVMVWTLGFIRFVEMIPRDGAVQAVRSDAVVVFTGGPKRLAAGISLLTGGMADKVFISGVNTEVKLNELEALLAEEGVHVPRDLLTCCVKLGFLAEDTTGNAHETADWVQRNGVRSILLVTSNYHMPRSQFELARAMPDVAIHPHPVVADSVMVDAWWRWPGSLRLLFLEYHKYILAGFRALIVDLLPGVLGA